MDLIRFQSPCEHALIGPWKIWSERTIYWGNEQVGNNPTGRTGFTP